MNEPWSDELEDDDAFEALLKDAFALPAGPGPLERGALLRCLRCGRTGQGTGATCRYDGGPMVPDGDGRIGQLVGSYRILECLGAGGAGTVYRARHRSLGREVAIKFLRAEVAQHGEYRARLAREAEVIGQLDHEHVVRVIDFLTPADASPVLIMEYIGGRTLERALRAAAERGSPLHARRALHITRQIAKALARAHGLGVLHRDIKPSNVMLSRSVDDDDVVKVLDFGIARAPSGLQLTGSQVVVGTPQYMSPEQALRGELGPPSDLYSLGCVLFEMLCGRPPFVGSPAMVMHAHVYTAPPPLETLASNVPAAVVALVHRLLQKSPASRFGDAHQLLSSIQAALPPALKSVLPSRQSVAPDAIRWPAMAGERELDRRLVERLSECERETPNPSDRACQAIAVARAALQELAAARAELDAAACAAAEEEHAFSERRRQMGRALDAVGSDLSAETVTVHSLSGDLSAAAGALGAAVTAVCQASGDLSETAITGGKLLADADANRLTQLRRAADRLAIADENHRVAKAAYQDGLYRRDDLAFQVGQLRGRLAMLQVEAKARDDASQARLSALYARQQACLEAAADAIDQAAKES